ncbi:MAG: pantetheine-phosphate adenylyltransferase [Candidatus Caldarchaeum sp.]
MCSKSRQVEWNVLVETVHALPLYASHKAYVRDEILLTKPNVSVEELVQRIGATRGEAMVILWELRKTGDEVLEMLKEGLHEQPVYSLAALGGTFSILHVGHMALLATAYSKAEKVLLGVSSDNFVAKLGKKHPIPPYEERVKQLRDFLSRQGWLERTRITALEDPYGPTVEDPAIEVLVTSPATAYRAGEINMKRTERNLPPLDVYVCPLVVADDGYPVSTTRIMAGEISADGKTFRKEQERG